MVPTCALNSGIVAAFDTIMYTGVIVPNFMNKMPTIQKEAWIVGMG